MNRVFPATPVVSGRHLSTSEAAEKIGVHQTTIVDWVQTGRFPNVYLESGRAVHGAFKIPEVDVVGLLVGKSASWDERVRQAAQEWLAARTNDGEEAVHYLDLEDFHFENERIPLKSRQRGIWKPRALDAALSITTTFRRAGQERPYEDEVGSDGMLRYKWQGDDADAADNRALRRAMTDHLPLIWFFGIAPGVYQPVFPVYLVSEEQEHQQFVVDIDPQLGVLNGDHLDPQELKIAKRYGTRLARTRLHQRLFRSSVIKAYDTRCAVCNLKHRQLLDAAHIIPDSDEKGTPDVSNGMAMCKIHHAAFDAGILGIRPDLIVEIRSDILAEVDGPMLKYGLQERHEQKLMSVPLRKRERPSPQALELAYIRFKIA
ncbi:HNH endonuclease [Arthrobacter sp. StoSoilB20]|uniref:HNH endonuclease n=1 Tax=Arthrobacter sp. StoSoilB20 TaxID=2830995 RepID=UPI001CC7F5C2|nr:HNH endonuclease [Arthrobacter sp. StoSoilB20]